MVEKRVLMIDDEPDFTEMTKTLLSFHDIAVDVYNDPLGIEKAISQRQYALVVSDLMMPNMDGFAVIKQLRGKTGYQKTPIIALSAKMLTDEERKLLLQHQVHFVTKPFDPQGLVDQIKQLLGI